MAGSLLVCQEIKVSPDELKKITGGGFVSPGDLVGGTVSEEARQLTEALKASQKRAAVAHEAEVSAKRVSTFVAIGSFMIAATGLYLSWISRGRR